MKDEEIKNMNESSSTSREDPTVPSIRIEADDGDHDDDDLIIDLERIELSTVDVIVKPKAYLKVLFHALRFANPSLPRREWKEVIGLLIGQLQHADTPLESIILVDAIPITHGTLVHAEFRDYARLARKIVDIRSPRFICGWYHSHPGHGVFMSETDYHTQLRYQKMWKKAIAAVIDPQLVTDNSFGWKIFRLNTNFDDWEHLEVEYADSFNPRMIPQLIELYAEILAQDEIITELET